MIPQVLDQFGDPGLACVCVWPIPTPVVLLLIVYDGMRYSSMHKMTPADGLLVLGGLEERMGAVWLVCFAKSALGWVVQ
jgi:hypothetical protein